MNDLQRSAMEQALEALECVDLQSLVPDYGSGHYSVTRCQGPQVKSAITALHAALAEPTTEDSSAVEPVAWMHTDPDNPRVKFLVWRENEPAYRGVWIKTPLYTAPPQRPAEPVHEPVAFITPLMEQQMFDDWCPHKGSPDPRTVWAAAVDSVNGLLLGASPPQRPTAGATYSDVVSDGGMDLR